MYNPLLNFENQIPHKWLTDASERSCLPHARAAAHGDIAAPPAVIAIHTAMDHDTSVMQDHLWVGKDGDRATFCWENNDTH